MGKSKGKVKSLVGWTMDGWYMSMGQVAHIPPITKYKRPWLCGEPVKVKITIEEVE